MLPWDPLAALHSRSGGEDRGIIGEEKIAIKLPLGMSDHGKSMTGEGPSIERRQNQLALSSVNLVFAGRAGLQWGRSVGRYALV